MVVLVLDLLFDLFGAFEEARPRLFLLGQDADDVVAVFRLQDMRAELHHRLVEDRLIQGLGGKTVFVGPVVLTALAGRRSLLQPAWPRRTEIAPARTRLPRSAKIA